MHSKQRSLVDRFLAGINDSMNTLWAPVPRARRRLPATAPDSTDLSSAQRRRSARYMRVNHVGEICAQALYQSQALTARDTATRNAMRQAAEEEIDHLAWCETRIGELNGRKSLLNPVWYAGSFAIGTFAGIAGDRWNLGFVAETENQVVTHLEGHLGKLPDNDQRSREIVSQMKIDEAQHAIQANQSGAATLPRPIKSLMRLASG